MNLKVAILVIFKAIIISTPKQETVEKQYMEIHKPSPIDNADKHKTF